MEKKEYLKEKFGLLKTEMNLLWSGMFVTFGGSLAIAMNLQFIWQLIIAAVGFAFFGIFLNAFFIKRIEVLKTIESLRE